MPAGSLKDRMEPTGDVMDVAREEWGELDAVRARWAPGLSGQGLRALYEDGLCPVPHWGYVISGSISVRYADGRVETASAGDLFYHEPGHQPFTDVGAEIVEFSPADAARANRERAAAARKS